MYRIKDSFLYKIFAKIDKNRDGLISYGEYLDWVEKFLAVLKLCSDEFYVLPEDDPNYRDGDILEELVKEAPLVKQPPQASKKSEVCIFKFSNYDFADKVRKRCWEFWKKYDSNRDDLFTEDEIARGLEAFLKANQDDLYYFLKNFFRYHRPTNGLAALDPLTDFCIQWHFGEMSIQRLHRKNTYQRGRDRVMNENEFKRTVNDALAYIELTMDDATSRLLFSEVDLDRDGWISY